MSIAKIHFDIRERSDARTHNIFLAVDDEKGKRREAVFLLKENPDVSDFVSVVRKIINAINEELKKK